MSFGDAINQALAGKAIARSGWIATRVFVSTPPGYEACLVIERLGTLWAGWTPTQGDMLAHDWTVL